MYTIGWKQYMSNLKFEDIKTKDYSPEDFKEFILSSHNEGEFSLSATNKNMYYRLDSFIKKYNSEHADSPTSIEEVVGILTGLKYVGPEDRFREREQEFVRRIKESMNEDGVVLYLDKKTRQFLKNKGQRLKKKTDSKEPYDVSKMIASLIPGAKYVPKQDKDAFSREKVLVMLSEITTSDGEIDLAKNPSLRSHFSFLAKKNGCTIEDEIAKTGYYTTKVTQHKIPINEHIQNIKTCVDSQGNIVNLSKKYPASFKFLQTFAKKNKCSFDDAVNILLESPLHEYTYRGVKNKLSMYDINSPIFIGNNEELRQEIVSAITAAMDSDKVIKGIYKNKKVNRMLHYICKYNDLKMSEAVSLFVPEAVFVDRQEPTMKHKTKEDVLNNLKLFDDGAGCIDSIRQNKNAYKSLRAFARQENMHVGDFVQKHSGYYFSSCSYEVDYIDYVVSRLVDRCGYGGSADGLYAKDRKLYDAVRRIKNFFPGGAKKSMQETFVELGFSYGGFVGKTKFTESYVKQLLSASFGDDKQISSLYDSGEVGYAIINYSGRIGKSVKETLNMFGYDYYNSNEKHQSRLASKIMSPEDYKRYSIYAGNAKGGKTHSEDPGDDDPGLE